MITQKYQQKAIEEMTECLVNLWRTQDRQIPIYLKSPTGSGKTYILTNFLNGLNHLPNWDYDKAFIWITFSDDLAMQSKDKFVDYLSTNNENDLLTVNDISRGKLFKNNILFLNWQKIVSRAAENKIIRRPSVDDPLYKETGYYFEDYIDNTHADKREIILIIDETKNAGTTLAQNMIDYMNPKIIIHVTATPDYEPTITEIRDNRAGWVEVDRNEVIDAGMIKEKIILQSEEDLRQHRGEDLDELLLNLGISKRLELKKEFGSIGKYINPLMLIQLPNDDKTLIERGEKTKEEIVMKYFERRGIPFNEIAMKFDGKEINYDKLLFDNDSEINFLLFKMAIGVGWDCPRAHVLVMFREIQSATFYVQTVGRILRMPEPDKKDDYKYSPKLRAGYLFTNYRRHEVEIPDQSNKNKPFIQAAHIKEGINNIELETEFISRIDYGDLTNAAIFQKHFIDSMNKYFQIGKTDILSKRHDKLENQDIELDVKINNSLVVNAIFEDYDKMSYEFKTKGIDYDLEMSKNDVEKTFNYFCYSVLREQTDERAKITNIARSWSPLKSALRIFLKHALGEDSDYYYRVFINDINKGAESKFRPAITNALIKYRPILNKLLEERKKKNEIKEKHIFKIKDEYLYTEDYKTINQKSCVLKEYYVRIENYLGKENENRFKSYIDKKNRYIEWWFKNGDEGKDYFSIKYFNTVDKKDKLFYPDWIIRFKNGNIGIFDTKAGMTATNTEGRAEGLAKWIKNNDNVIGGICVYENGIWYYNDSEEYEYIQGRMNEDWKKMEDLFR